MCVQAQTATFNPAVKKQLDTVSVKGWQYRKFLFNMYAHTRDSLSAAFKIKADEVEEVTMRSQAKLKKMLQSIVNHAPNSLKATVAHEALDHEDIACFFSDLLQHCYQSGMIGSLIYYSDTCEFYDTYYHEIETIRYELEQSMAEVLKPQGALKNWYAWLGYEETARQLAEGLGIDW